MRATPFAALLLAATFGCSQEERPATPSSPEPSPAPVVPDAAPAAAPVAVDAGAPGFVVEPVLDLAESRAGAGMKSYTSEGKDPPPGPEFAIFRVVVGPPASADPAAEARKRLQGSDLATGVKVESQRPIRIDGMSGFAGEARGTFSGTPVRIYQVALFESARSYVMQGRSSAERWNWYQAAFERMAGSFKRR